MRSRISRFFTPDPDVPFWKRLLPYCVVILVGILLFVLAGAGWEYTNSSTFCGNSCHAMTPVFISYQRSPHAQVKCVECHIGRDYIAIQISRKAGDIQHLIDTLHGKYQTPIYATKMRTAAEICERCHNSKQFLDNRLKELKHFDTDKANEEKITYLNLKVGGGAPEEGLGTGMHWHVANKVQYLSLDPYYLSQKIPWVSVTNPETGETEEFVDVTAELPADFLPQNQQRIQTVDCITCHNRVSHTYPTPATAIDDAMARGLIDRSIPYFKRNALAVMAPLYPSYEEAEKAIMGLEDYYQTYWPEEYAKRGEKIHEAVAQVMTLYRNIVFPDLYLNWNTHPDNIGHRTFPGCFRCHDGKHLNQKGESIPAECNACHSIPIQNQPDGSIASLPVSEAFQPRSHNESNWLAKHRFAFDDTCDGCHDIPDVALYDRKGFCANDGCHAENTEPYLGVNTDPILRLSNVLTTTLPTSPSAPLTWDDLIGPILLQRCGPCHGDAGGLNLEKFDRAMTGTPQGPVIFTDSPDASPIVLVQTAGHPNRLPPEALDWLKQWIASGAPKESLSK